MTKKFWCHYIGSDGNTPKRRNIELTDISELLPNVSNEGVKTPLWFEREEEDYGYRIYTHYHLYVQLSDKVATMVDSISDQLVERMVKTDEDIKAQGEEWMKDFLERNPNASEEYRNREAKWNEESMEGAKKDRDNLLQRLALFLDYDTVLLSGDAWIMASAIKAYEEVQSPYLPVIQELRRQAMAERERREQERKEERRKAAEEEARKKAEAEQKEQERLTQEAEKFKQGESISGEDVVDLCRRYGIAIHLRTVHNLQQIIYVINGKTGTCQYYRQSKGKRRPQLDGCYKTAEELYQYLQTH